MKKVIVNRRIFIALTKVLKVHGRDTVLKLHTSNPNGWVGEVEILREVPLKQLKNMLDYGFEMEKPKTMSEMMSEYSKALNRKEDAKKPIQVSVELGQALDYVLSECKQEKGRVLFSHSLLQGDYIRQAEPLNNVSQDELKTLLEEGYYYANEKREDDGMEKKIMVSEAVERALDYLLYDRGWEVSDILRTHSKASTSWNGATKILNCVSYESLEIALKQGYWSAKTKAASERIESAEEKVKGFFARKSENLAPIYERETNLDKRGLKELQLAYEDVADLTSDHVWMQELMGKAGKRH